MPHRTFSADLYRHALHVSATPTLLLNREAGVQRIIYVNPAFELMSGYTAGEILGRGWSVLSAGQEVAGASEFSRCAGCENASATFAFWGQNKNGEALWLEARLTSLSAIQEGMSAICVAEFRDMTGERAEREQLEHLAMHDALTGLPNRRLLQDRLDRAIARVRRSDQIFAVAFIDLDGFKFINDTFGHETGDEILRQVGHRLGSSLRTGDTAARVGGDEFVLLLENSEGASMAEAVERILERVRQPITIGDNEFTVSCSVGVTCYPRDGRDPAALVRSADRAMFELKRYNQGMGAARSGLRQ